MDPVNLRRAALTFLAVGLMTTAIARRSACPTVRRRARSERGGRIRRLANQGPRARLQPRSRRSARAVPRRRSRPIPRPGPAPAGRGHDVDPAAVRAGGRHRRRLPRPGAIGSSPGPPLRPKWRPHFNRTSIEPSSLCERRLRDNPADADAHYQVGAAYGFLTHRTPRRSKAAWSAGFGAARRAYAEHERVTGARPRPQGRRA